MTYTLTSGSMVIRDEDGACIPFHEGNTDYQEYLAWLGKDGNKPNPYVPPEMPELTVEEKLASIGLTVNDIKDVLKAN